MYRDLLGGGGGGEGPRKFFSPPQNFFPPPPRLTCPPPPPPQKKCHLKKIYFLLIMYEPYICNHCFPNNCFCCLFSVDWVWVGTVQRGGGGQAPRRKQEQHKISFLHSSWHSPFFKPSRFIKDFLPRTVNTRMN